MEKTNATSHTVAKFSCDNIYIRHINKDRHINVTKRSYNEKIRETFRFLLTNKNVKKIPRLSRFSRSQ